MNFVHPLESVFQIATAIRSPLDQADVWTTSSTHVILQIVQLDCQSDI